MQVKVIGKKTGKFTDKATGEVIEYGQLHVVAPFEKNDFKDAPETNGMQCMIVKVKPDKLEKVKVGSEVVLVFNQHGKVDDVVIADDFADNSTKADKHTKSHVA